ncbi:MAG: histidine triad nucleotide-binding protein [Nitrospirae bacterium]|nr:MAG: histidine triad nucleotide-binding protein [Nitrospirota bacterium]
MSDCLFCKIGSGQIPAKVVLQDDEVLAFDDVNPQAPVHVLVIPKRHVSALNDAGAGDQALLGRLLEAAILVARKKGIAEAGYRVVANTGRDGGQTVFHLHLHVLGGRHMNWPPG